MRRRGASGGVFSLACCSMCGTMFGTKDPIDLRKPSGFRLQSVRQVRIWDLIECSRDIDQTKSHQEKGGTAAMMTFMGG